MQHRGIYFTGHQRRTLLLDDFQMSNFKVFPVMRIRIHLSPWIRIQIQRYKMKGFSAPKLLRNKLKEDTIADILLIRAKL